MFVSWHASSRLTSSNNQAPLTAKTAQLQEWRNRILSKYFLSFILSFVLRIRKSKCKHDIHIFTISWGISIFSVYFCIFPLSYIYMYIQLNILTHSKCIYNMIFTFSLAYLKFFFLSIVQFSSLLPFFLSWVSNTQPHHWILSTLKIQDKKSSIEYWE